MDQQTFIEANRVNETEEKFERPTASIFQRIFCDRLYQGFAIIVVFAVVIPVLVFYFSNDFVRSEPDENFVCLLERGYRVSCGSENITAEKCLSLNCCYEDADYECYHSIPAAYGYELGPVLDVFRTTSNTTPFGNPMLDEVKISRSDGENTVRFTLHGVGARYLETRIPEARMSYNISWYFRPYWVEVFRPSGERIFTTARGPLIASDGYWEWTFQLTGDELFGLGELLLNSTEPITKVIYKNGEEHVAEPVFLAHQGGMFHGAYVEHDGPLEVTVMPSGLVILRCLAGAGVTVTLSTGPTLKEALAQMRKEAYDVPERWMLGGHICRTFGIGELADAISAYNSIVDIEVAYTSDCIYDDLMLMLLPENDNSIINDLVELVTRLRSNSVKFMLSLPPQVPVGEYWLFEEAVRSNVFYKNETGGVLIGNYSGIEVAYLDFSAQKIGAWMSQMFEEKRISEMDPDGYVLIDNWPSEETYNMTDEKAFPYINKNIMTAMSKTIPWHLNNSESRPHVLVHNEYGVEHLRAIESLASGKPILTSSYRFGTNRPAVVRNVSTTWTNLKKTMVTNLNQALFGHPLTASPVCGSAFYTTDAQERICRRWHLLSSTLPMHYVSMHWTTKAGKQLAREVLDFRRSISYYTYGLLKLQEPIARPMFYDFYADNATFALDEQYMVGEGLMVAHPTGPGEYSLRVYFPEVETGWYEFWGGKLHGDAGWASLETVGGDHVIYIKAGTIVPFIEKDESGEYNSFVLSVALNCQENECTANGSTIIEENTLEVFATNSTIVLKNVEKVKCDLGCTCDATEKHPTLLKGVRLYHDSEQVKDVFINLPLCDITGDEYTVALV